MEKIEYRIGGLTINPHVFIGNPLWSPHRFIVEAIENNLSIYVAPVSKHHEVAYNYDFSDLSGIVGGGGCYRDDNGSLVIDHFSTEFGAIPKIAASRFGELLVPQLKQRGLDISGIIANPVEEEIRDYWRKLGLAA